MAVPNELDSALFKPNLNLCKFFGSAWWAKSAVIFTLWIAGVGTK